MSKTQVLYFTAKWCGPCKLFGPIFEEVSSEINEAEFEKIDVDANHERAAEYNIRSIPTILILKEGEIVDKMVGAQSAAVFKNKVEAAI